MADHAPLTDEELAATEARAHAAAEGPWEVVADDGGRDMHGWRTDTTIRTAGWPENGWSKYGFVPTDAEFIAHARTDVQRLITDLRAARAEAKEWQDRV